MSLSWVVVQDKCIVVPLVVVQCMAAAALVVDDIAEAWRCYYCCLTTTCSRKKPHVGAAVEKVAVDNGWDDRCTTPRRY